MSPDVNGVNGMKASASEDIESGRKTQSPIDETGSHLGEAVSGLSMDEVHVESFRLARSNLSASDATAVRKQVDYYFSDDNLVHDKFLIGKMKGRKNRPVPLKIIHSFKKMQEFQPESAVLDALRISKSVNVIKEDGKWCLQRKQPFIKEEATGEKKPKSKKASKPSGFEEWYADPPLTADDSKVEEDLYNPSRALADRLETALQRYQAKRKFHSSTRTVFERWMNLGGVDSGQKQFSGGFDQEAAEDKTAKEIAAMKATTYIRGEERDEDGNPIRKVDFEGVARCFLSSQVPLLWDWEDESRIKECTNILRNFYRYIILHNVCPEHQDDIDAAIRVCDLADKELFACKRATTLFPGDFNVACSTLFGGLCQGLYAEGEQWAQDDVSVAIASGMSTLRARQVFSLCVAAHASNEDFLGDRPSTKAKLLEQKIVREEDMLSYEVVEIIQPSEDIVKFYASFKADLKPTGKLRCRLWRDLDEEEEEDLPPGVPSSLASRTEDQRVDEFFVEQDILNWCFGEMKIEAFVYTLSRGMKFIDNIISCKCSFYKSLPNEVMRGWKEPRWISREEQKERLARIAASGRAGADDEGEYDSD